MPDFNLMCIRWLVFWVHTIYVKEQDRRRGLGKILYDDLLWIASKRGFTEIYCDVFTLNTTSKNFHREQGFEPVYTVYRRTL